MAVRKRVMWLLVAVLMSLGPVTHATGKIGRESLKGIKALEVAVEVLGDDERQAGLTRSSLKVLVEVRLRKAGIKVVDSSSTEPGAPWLYLNVGCVPDRMGQKIVAFTYSNRLELKQGALLERNSRLAIATTWASHWFGHCGTQRLTAIERSVERLVDEFIDDFLAMNPIERSK